MSRLLEWLDHRKDVVGLETWKDLAEYSGVSLQVLDEVRASQTLSYINRSERRCLAAALRVSLRKLEQLSDGTIDWIEDSYVYDVDTRRRPSADREECDAVFSMLKDVQPGDRGTPVVGHITRSGRAEADEEWQEDWGKRLPARFGRGQGIYAMEVEGMDRCVVFRNVAPWEFRTGQAAIYCWNGWEAVGWFGEVNMGVETAAITTLDGKRQELSASTVVRIGKKIANWDGEPSVN